jgi:hypothetical protein
MAKITNGPAGVIFNDTTASPAVALGTIGYTDDGGEVVYCVSSGAISQYALCGINEDFDVYMMTTALSVQSDRLGFPQIAFGAGEYGWVYTRGSNIKVRTKASAAADALLSTMRLRPLPSSLMAWFWLRRLALRRTVQRASR